MPVEIFYRMVCGGMLEIDSGSPSLVPFVKHRIFGLKKGEKKFECGHLSVFERGEPEYIDFLCKEGDSAAMEIAKYGFSKLKGEVHFHEIEEGVENEDYFRKTLQRLLKQIEAIENSKTLKETEKRTQIKKLILHKFKGYQEFVK